MLFLERSLMLWVLDLPYGVLIWLVLLVILDFQVKDMSRNVHKTRGQTRVHALDMYLHARRAIKP